MGMHHDSGIMEFPCAFPIKIFGRDVPQFHRTARDIVEQHVGALDDNAIRTAESRRGRFVSITITIRASSRTQLDAIYVDLCGHDDVLMAL